MTMLFLITSLLFLIPGSITSDPEEYEEIFTSSQYTCSYGGLVVPAGFKVTADACGECICPENPTRPNQAVSCDACSTCQFHNTIKKHRQVWWDGCVKCECSDGTIICIEQTCPKKCHTESGETYFEEEQWTDECNMCRCDKKRGTLCTRKQCDCSEDGKILGKHGDVIYVKGKGSCLCLDAKLNCSIFGGIEELLFS